MDGNRQIVMLIWIHAHPDYKRRSKGPAFCSDIVSCSYAQVRFKFDQSALLTTLSIETILDPALFEVPDSSWIKQS